MIDEIFAQIMKEARSRKGKDLGLNIYTVLMDIQMKIYPVMQAIREEERRDKKDENKGSDT